MRDLVLVSLNPDFCELARAAFPDAEIWKSDVARLETNGTAFVSPANSLGFMDGGIDAAYRRMFPGCEPIVKSAIAKIGQRTNLGRAYLRVGSVFWQQVKSGGTYLVTAPTMFLPHNVSQTQNAYWAMRAILMAYDRIRFGSPQTTRLVVPSLCCGWGGMKPADSVAQIARAIADHERDGSLPIDVEGLNYFLLPSRDHEQPSNFDNREIDVPFGAFVEEGAIKMVTLGF
jgi:O-acetyl-ADP-ribose deacetylase (regulator of RNase III)